MSFSRILHKIVERAAENAAVGAATGALGSAILSSAGYTQYNCLEATQTNAIGAAVLGGASGLLEGYFDIDQETLNKQKTMVGIAAGVTLNGVIGKAILDEAVRIPIGKSALAGLTGLGVIVGGIATGAVVVLGLGYCMVNCLNMYEASRYQPAAPENPPRPLSP